MGKGRPRAVEKGGAASACASSSSSSSAAGSGPSAVVPQAPVFYPTEEEFLNPLDFIYKIRPQAEPFGICRIVPPKSWSPPFALDRQAFAFPTKSQAIHRLQARPPSCDPETFRLEYGRFLEARQGKRPPQRRRLVFEGDPLDLCRLFNAVKRYGGYDKVCREKLWGDVARFVRPAFAKVSECAKHVLCQLYLEHLYDYEEYTSSQADRATKRGRKGSRPSEQSCRKRRRKKAGHSRVEEVAPDEASFDQICEQCKSGLHAEVMLLCDRCDKGWHLYCLSPPLESVPAGNWYCLDCVNSDKDGFGFVPGKLCTLEEFKRIDDRMKKKWFGQTNVSRVLIEKKFWEIVEGRIGEVEVMYGSDLDTSLYGSGFPRVDDDVISQVDPNVWRQYASSTWNLNNLPKLKGSMLRAVHDNIAGVMVPWLYIGMLFSSFCWHVEDHCFYSINYLHWGEPKCWYGIPGSEANAFEQVMQNALPDLFEAQPDLLFQLVTMLNPSILQENGVPVYGVLQEPGNFVITFPRSFHAGFNLGLNCAEAVNFAPADWLPHGRVGSELYRLYRKTAVLSHEELVCMAAKSDCDTKSLRYIKEEMQNVFDIEKKCREELWINGVIESSPMVPRENVNYIGMEEDKTCIICHQYLYLSAITCSCRPSAFVCLQHWSHLCECSLDKHHLLYRHTIAELGDLVYMMMSCGSEQSNAYSYHGYCNRSSSMTKKVKGAEVSYVRLAEDWLSKSCHILEGPCSHAAYTVALKEAEQFLWADHDMDPVRHMSTELHEAQKWALDMNSCLSKVKNCMNSRKYVEKVSLCELERVCSMPSLPRYEPSLSKLKAYIAEARKLDAELTSALLSNLSIGDLEVLHSRATKFPVSLPNTDKLANEISSAKVWLDNASLCIAEKGTGSIDIDFLMNLKSQMPELHVHVPDMDMLSNLCKEAESWQSRCKEIFKGPIRLKELEEFLLSADNLTVNIPELSVLREYSYDARSWISSLHSVLQEIKELKDHGHIVGELSRILKAGQFLKVQVDELPIVEMELKKSSCRQTASKALQARFPLDSIQKVFFEASQLGIENEQLFVDVSCLINRATSWEAKAKVVLENGAHVNAFEDMIRESDDILVVLPSLSSLKDALLTAKSWITRSQPYLKQATDGSSLGLLLKVDELKDLVTFSKLLKVNLDSPEKLESILRKVEGWEHDAYSLLENSKYFFETDYADFLDDNYLSTKIEEFLCQIESAIVSGNSIGLELEALPELKSVSWSLNWCLTALSFCHKVPLFQEADDLLGDARQLPLTLTNSCLAKVLIEGTNWLKRALCLLPEARSSVRFILKDVEIVLEEIRKLAIQYPVMVTDLQAAIQKHESWVKQANNFFELPGQLSWPSLLMLKECGDSVAFQCVELDKVNSEIVKVESWKSECQTVLEPLVGHYDSLSAKLMKIKDSLDRALYICNGSKSRKTRAFSVCCPNDLENEEVYTCLKCEDWYHLSCVGSPLAIAGMTNEYSCPFCHFTESGIVYRNGSLTLISRENRPEVESFFQLLYSAGDLCAGVDELNLVEEIIKQILDFRSYMTKILNDAIFHCAKDLSSISEILLSALKALTVSRIYDHQYCSDLQLALSRNSWKVRVKNLLRGSIKPIIQQFLHLIKEGSTLEIPSEDYFLKEITGARKKCLSWAETARKVASDSGDLALCEVYKLINEGENLPVRFEKELQLLRDRSVLYCICRRPDDHQTPMVACDQCDEWYHFDCIKLCKTLPKTFYCAACQLPNGELISLPRPLHLEERTMNDSGPHTPPACSSTANHARARNFGHVSQHNSQSAVNLLNILRSFDDVNMWRENKRPLQRTAKRRLNLDGIFHYLGFPVVNR